MIPHDDQYYPDLGAEDLDLIDDNADAYGRDYATTKRLVKDGSARSSPGSYLMKTQDEIHMNKHAVGDLQFAPNRAIVGRELEAGDVLEADDVYDGSNGSWQKCPCPDLKLQAGVATKWVRPSAFDVDDPGDEG